MVRHGHIMERDIAIAKPRVHKRMEVSEKVK